MFTSLIGIVRPTSQLQVLCRRRAAIRERDHMVELEKSAFPASSSASHKRTLTLIACPHRAFHCCGYVAAGRLCNNVGSARPLGIRKLPAFDVAKQQRNRAVEDFSDVTVWHDVSHQVLK